DAMDWIEHRENLRAVSGIRHGRRDLTARHVAIPPDDLEGNSSSSGRPKMLWLTRDYSMASPPAPDCACGARSPAPMSLIAGSPLSSARPALAAGASTVGSFCAGASSCA